MSVKKTPDPSDQHVGNRVRMRRLMTKMSQTDLSRALGLSWQAVQKYENGTVRIGASRLQQIARILQVSPAYFFESTSGATKAPAKRKEAAPDYVTEFLATRDGLLLAKALTRVKDIERRRRIVRLIVEIMGRI
jgi:transcriptional regulator with XRE-family HTH domain